MLKTLLMKSLFFVATGVGVLVFVLMMRNKQAAPLRPAAEVVTTARTITVPKMDVIPRALGYGVARPGRVWQAVPQVGGRIVELSPLVREGTFVKAEHVLVRIDRSDYDLEVTASEARITALDAQYAELEARETTIRTTLDLEERSLKLAHAEVERIRALVVQRTLPQADLDREERTALTQGLRAQEMQNALTLLDPQKKMIQAQRAQEEAALARLRLAVKRTVIRAPYDVRIGPVTVEQDQVVQVGQALFSADGTDSSEVTAWLPMQGLRGVLTASMAEVDAADITRDPAEHFGLEAEARMGFGAGQIRWPAKVVRIRGVDAQTRTLGLDVSVPEPYRGVIPGARPPLTRGMYVEVEIRARKRPGLVLVPRTALHDGHVHLVDAEDRLERRPVTLGLVQSGFAVVTDGLDGGETLILSDLVPAVHGMRVTSVPDADAQAGLEADAAGKTAVR